MKKPSPDQEPRRATGLEENLKKALTELLILFLFNESEHYIGELSTQLKERSHGVLNVVFPYAAIYRMTEAGYLTETQKRHAPDGRRRQYYKITDQGRVHLQASIEMYRLFSQGVEDILSGEVENDEST